MQRALIERDLRTAEFAARLRGAPLIDLQRLENLTARQLLELRTELPPELRPYERQKAASNADAFVLRLPPPIVRPRAALTPRALPVQMPCAVRVVPVDGAEAPIDRIPLRGCES